MRFYQILLITILAAAAMTGVVGRPLGSRSSRIATLRSKALLTSADTVDIQCRQFILGMAKAFNLTSLSMQSLASVNATTFPLPDLETALNLFGAVQFDDTILPLTLSQLSNIFSNVSPLLPSVTSNMMETIQQILQSPMTFNKIKVAFYEDTDIDCQLYLWGSLDYILFDDYSTVGETFGTVIARMSKYLEKQPQSYLETALKQAVHGEKEGERV